MKKKKEKRKKLDSLIWFDLKDPTKKSKISLTCSINRTNQLIYSESAEEEMQDFKVDQKDSSRICRQLAILQDNEM